MSEPAPAARGGCIIAGRQTSRVAGTITYVFNLLPAKSRWVVASSANEVSLAEHASGTRKRNRRRHKHSRTRNKGQIGLRT